MSIDNTRVQATIAIDRGAAVSFENFHAGDNHATVQLLQETLSNQAPATSCYLWGERGSGKTHLLFSACKCVSSSVYIPILDLDLQADCLDGLEHSRLICVDDIQSIAKQPVWEKQILNLMENVINHGNLLLLTGDCPPDKLNFNLQDLVNRLKGRQVLKLSPTTDQIKTNILIDRLAERGLWIEAVVVEYILSRYSRDMHSLIRLLDRIALVSLEKKCKVTIPFLRGLDEFQNYV